MYAAGFTNTRFRREHARRLHAHHKTSTRSKYRMINYKLKLSLAHLPRSKIGQVLQKRNWVASPGAKVKVNLKSTSLLLQFTKIDKTLGCYCCCYYCTTTTPHLEITKKINIPAREGWWSAKGIGTCNIINI